MQTGSPEAASGHSLPGSDETLRDRLGLRHTMPRDHIGRPVRTGAAVARQCVLAILAQQVGIAAEHVGQGRAHAQDQDRQAGHGGSDAPGRVRDPVLRKKVVGDLARHAQHQRPDR